uniref:THUMP domain-containing protein n=1 Tax=Castellaniella defragrans TaxID=75697 RepID=UPI0033415B49
MSDTPARKTLSLKGKAPAAKDREAPRKRSGARARQVALQEHAQHQSPDTHAPASEPSLRRKPARPGAARQPQEAAPAPRERRRPQDASPAPRGSRRPQDTPSASREDQRPHDAPAPRHEAPRNPATAEPDARIRRVRRPREAEVFDLFAPCPHGLEPALALELEALGYDAVHAGRAGCHFRADWMGVLRANLCSRLATRILVRVAQAEIRTEDDILELARQTPWERWFGAEQTLRVDTSAVRSPLRSLQYCNLRAKDGICDRLREREGSRPDIDTVRPDARVHLFLDASQATLYLDVSGESLFKRGWRLDKGEAPLRENLAAGLLALSGWTPDKPLLDPFCGSGTILIEAAWIALGVPPGIWRPFSFERLRNHDARQWRDLKEDARARIAPRLDQALVGCDLDPAAIAAARANLERAHLTPESIHLEISDARQMPPPAPEGWIITNPPYGERLSKDEADLWPQWASHLKRHYDGWRLNIITSDLDLPAHMRLKAHRRHPLHNGALDCRLFQFNIVAAGYRDGDRE